MTDNTIRYLLQELRIKQRIIRQNKQMQHGSIDHAYP